MECEGKRKKTGHECEKAGRTIERKRAALTMLVGEGAALHGSAHRCDYASGDYLF
jgi:hypothetical protein